VRECVDGECGGRLWVGVRVDTVEQSAVMTQTIIVRSARRTNKEFGGEFGLFVESGMEFDVEAAFGAMALAVSE